LEWQHACMHERVRMLEIAAAAGDRAAQYVAVHRTVLCTGWCYAQDSAMHRRCYAARCYAQDGAPHRTLLCTGWCSAQDGAPHRTVLCRRQPQ